MKPIATLLAPKAIGPYSQAIEAAAGRLVFCAGQIPLDPASGQKNWDFACRGVKS